MLDRSSESLGPRMAVVLHKLGFDVNHVPNLPAAYRKPLPLPVSDQDKLDDSRTSQDEIREITLRAHPSILTGTQWSHPSSKIHYLYEAYQIRRTSPGATLKPGEERYWNNLERALASWKDAPPEFLRKMAQSPDESMLWTLRRNPATPKDLSPGSNRITRRRNSSGG